MVNLFLGIYVLGVQMFFYSGQFREESFESYFDW